MKFKTHIISLVLMFVLFSFARYSNAQATQSSYTYYGFVPSRIYCFNPNDAYPNDPLGALTRRPPHNASEIDHVREYGVLLITGNHDNTRCQLYRLPEKQLLEEFSLDKLELKAATLPNGTFFKLVSDKFVTVVLKGGAFINRVIADTYNADVSTYYPSVDGGYVGKEFIFPATLGRVLFTPYRIFSLEDCTVEIYKADGSLFKEFDVSANSIIKFSPSNGTVYHIESTGYIMVSTFSFTESYFVPSVEGGFVGKTFYGNGEKRLGGRGEWAFRSYTFISSVESSKAELSDLNVRKWVREFDVPSHSAVTVTTNDLTEVAFETACYVLSAEDPVTVLYISNSTVEGGVSAAGLRANEKALIQVPEGEAFIFAIEDCTLTLNGLKFELGADEFMPLDLGIYEIEATGRVAIQIADIAEYRGLLGFAEALPAVEAVGLSPEDLEIKPLTEEEGGFNMTYIVAAAAVVIVAAAGFMLYKRRTGSKR
ncbi:MAG: hypothetical protein ACETWE_11460 [Candidatus Bathyarchaeia archaeon]